MYVIQKNDGKFVAEAGSKSSYTKDLRLARKFKTKEEAQSDICPENETVISIDNLLNI